LPPKNNGHEKEMHQSLPSILSFTYIRMYIPFSSSMCLFYTLFSLYIYTHKHIFYVFTCLSCMY
jgi:hypothetical protein